MKKQIRDNARKIAELKGLGPSLSDKKFISFIKDPVIQLSYIAWKWKQPENEMEILFIKLYSSFKGLMPFLLECRKSNKYRICIDEDVHLDCIVDDFCILKEDFDSEEGLILALQKCMIHFLELKKEETKTEITPTFHEQFEMAKKAVKDTDGILPTTVYTKLLDDMFTPFHKYLINGIGDDKDIWFRGRTIKDDKWVEGKLYFSNDSKRRYRIIDKANIQTEVLVHSIGVTKKGLTDKNGRQMFASLEIDGKMSRGGDVIEFDNLREGSECIIDYVFKNSHFIVYPDSEYINFKILTCQWLEQKTLKSK